jgi:hypothetical protein
MRMDVVTGRRLGGALFVLGGLIVAAIVVWPSGGGDTPSSKPGPPAKIQPVRIVSVPQLGLAFAHPRTWSADVTGRVIRLRSPDATSLLTFSSPTPGHHTQRVESDTERELLQRFAPAKIVREGPAKLGTQPAASFELTGFSPDNDDVRVLVVVASTQERTYTVTLLTPVRPSAKRVAEAQQILATVRLTKPVAVSAPATP